MDIDFVGFVDGDGRNILLNIRLIRQVILGDAGLEIWFSETHKITIDGVGIKEWYVRLAERSIALNGEPLGPAIRARFMEGETPSSV